MKRLLDVDDARRLLVITPENYRPDLASPIGSARSPTPSHHGYGHRKHHPHGHGTSRQSIDSDTTSKLRRSADDLLSLRTMQSYSTNFDSETSVSQTLNIPQYSEDFETASVTGPVSRYLRTPSHSGRLETLPSSAIETVDEDLFRTEDTYPGTASGRTSRLTWQYSEDFEAGEDESYALTEDVTGSTDSTQSVTTRRQSDTSTGSDVDSSEQDWTSQSDSGTVSSSSSPQWSEATIEASHVAEQAFISNMLRRITSDTKQHTRKANLRDTQPHRTQQSGNLKPRKVTKETKACDTFCKKAIEKIQHPSGPISRADQDPLDIKLRLHGLPPGDCVENYGVSRQAINRLRMENTQANLERMANETFHEPEKCQDCISVQAKLAHAEFVKQKLHLALNRKIQEKVDQTCVENLASHLVKNPACLPGRLQIDFGHLEPSAIWSHLGQKNEEDDTTSNSTELRENAISDSDGQILCPHARKNLYGRNKDNRSTEIDDIIQKQTKRTHKEAEDVMRQLSHEANYLSSLSSKEFWKLFFDKLSVN